jgi:hypothetical protein
MNVVPFAAIHAASWLAAARMMPIAPRLERACAAASLSLALPIGLVYALGVFGAIGATGWTVSAIGWASGSGSRAGGAPGRSRATTCARSARPCGRSTR